MYPWFDAQKSCLPQSAAFGILVAFRYPLGLWDPILPAPNELGTIPSEYQSQKHASNYGTILIISLIAARTDGKGTGNLTCVPH